MSLLSRLGIRPGRDTGSTSPRSVGRSHVGLVRSLNEDRLLLRPDLGLWAVADGMGGHQAGDVAAAEIVDRLGTLAVARREAVAEGLARSNTLLRDMALDVGPDTVIGATVVALLIDKTCYTALWAGDSRAYLFRAGRLARITRDHSPVQDLIDGGVLTDAEARRHPQASAVSRAVGADETLDLDQVRGELRRGDRFLLCSDGLTGMLDDAEIAARLAADPIERAADALIDAALARGGRDNVTLVIVDCG